MDFRVLGPLEVAGDDGALPLGGAKQRSVLALLLLHVNELVTADQLVDEIWGGEPPPTAGKSVQVYVSRLRKVLGPERLTTRAGGYVLELEPNELDLARFERLAGEAGRCPPAVAAEKLREALGLWRGPALADLAYEGFAQPEIGRMEELRLVVLEQRIEADLALGRHAEVVGELEALASRHPLRERLRGQLMLALYRSGRQAEALETYRATRRELAEELGLEPGEQLRRLEQSILRQDPALAPPKAEEAAVPLAEPARAILLVPSRLARLGELIALARPLAAPGSPHELMLVAVVAPDELETSTSALARERVELGGSGVIARTAAFSSPARGEDVARLAGQQAADLLVMDCSGAEVDAHTRAVLERAPCDVALLVRAGGPPRDGPVMVPFGAGHHDWAALALGAWIARSADRPLRLIGAAAGDVGRDASRLLADASLIVQRTAGVAAEPLIGPAGRHGVAGLAVDAGLLVLGLSERWRHEGLGRVRAELLADPPAPTVLVRRGVRPSGIAPAETRTRLGWSVTGTGVS